MTEVQIKSSERGGYLKFLRTDAESFSVEVGSPSFWGCAAVSAYHVGSPAQLFHDMAESWRGWTGEKVWDDLDGQLRLSATIDSLGHVSLEVELQDSTYTSKVTTVLVLDAGQLAEIARLISVARIGVHNEDYPIVHLTEKP